MRVAIDGVEVIAVEDAAPLPVGTLSYAGVGIGSSTLLVDDVTVWIPASAEPTATPTETETATATATASPTATSTPPSTSNFTLVYNQNFDGSSDPYYQLSDTWPIIPSEQDYALYLSGPKYVTRVTRYRLNTSQIEARFYITQGVAELGLRRGSSTQGYLAMVGADGQVRLYRDTTLVQSVGLTQPVIGQWHTLRLFANENTVQVMVDGQLLLTYVDPQPLPRGTTYFAADQLSDSYILIDDIRLWTPEIQFAPTTPQPTFNRSQSIAPRFQLQTLSGNDWYNALTDYEFGTDEQLAMDTGEVEASLKLLTAAGLTTLSNQNRNIENSSYINLSANGRRVAFNCGNPDGICVVNVDGSDFAHIDIQGLNLVRNPAWSPDGKQLAFEAAGDNPSETGIWVVKLDDSSLTQLLMAAAIHTGCKGKMAAFSSITARMKISINCVPMSFRQPPM